MTPPPGAGDPKKAYELNVTLAIVTGLALALLVVSAAFFGPAQRRWVVIVLAPAIVALYFLFKRYVFKMAERPPLIQPDAPVTLLMAAAIPLIIVIVACCAAMWPGHDYSIAVLAASVIFGLTLEGALKKPAA
ncbi:MAG TPA: hypothetical protein VG407_09340 [Caulobacteraceae bacterium]|jgi:hypothetical protein|nr:hypothetical protein [Caulobacteraceae bacterium]